MPMPNNFKVGDRIDLLTILSLRKINEGNRKSVMIWLVACDCGREPFEMRTNAIKVKKERGNASCGCTRIRKPKVGRRSCIKRAHEMIEEMDARDPTPEQIYERCKEIRIEKGDWLE